jgi:hypothetical protein
LTDLRLVDLINRAGRGPWGILQTRLRTLPDDCLLDSYKEDFAPIIKAIQGRDCVPVNLAEAVGEAIRKKDIQSLRDILWLCFEEAAEHEWPDIVKPPVTFGLQGNLSPRRRLIAGLWVAVLAGSCLYPPWTARGGYARGLGLIFYPPYYAMHVDISRLAVEWILATIIAGGFFFGWPKAKEIKQRDSDS